jgi:hypothetical protein
MIKFINIRCVKLGDQVIDFLIESLQGPCKANQRELANNSIVDYVKDVLIQFKEDIDYERRGFSPDGSDGSTLFLAAREAELKREENKEILEEFKSVIDKMIILLSTLIEGNDDKEIVEKLIVTVSSSEAKSMKTKLK